MVCSITSSLSFSNTGLVNVLVVIKNDSKLLSQLFKRRELGTLVRNCQCFLCSFVDFEEFLTVVITCFRIQPDHIE